MSSDSAELQPSTASELKSIADSVRSLGMLGVGEPRRTLLALGDVLFNDPRRLIGVDLVTAFPPHILLPDDPMPSLSARLQDALRLLRYLLLLALFLIIWLLLWSVFSSYGRTTGNHLSFYSWMGSWIFPT